MILNIHELATWCIALTGICTASILTTAFTSSSY